MLSRLIERQKQTNAAVETLKEKRAAIVQLATDDGREDLTDDEDAEFRSVQDDIKAKEEEVIRLGERIAELNEDEKRAANAAASFKKSAFIESAARVKDEALTYSKESRNSYFRDLTMATVNNDLTARDRLERHAREMEVEQRTNPNRTDGQGGYFVPPMWLMDEYAEYLRAGRVTANLVTNMALPAGTDSLNIPKFSTPTRTDIQAGDGGSVSSVDMTDTTAAAGVKTIAGQQDIAIQLLEQSPLPFDQIIFRDLIADLNMRTDIQVINGAGGSNEVLGILGVTNGVTTTSYTGTTVSNLYSKLAGAINSVHTSRYLPPDIIVMHPRRWAYLLASTDSNGRPLVVPNPQGPFNTMGEFGAVESQGIVGSLQGISVAVDANVPTNLGSSTNEDRIIIFRRSDPMLFEGPLNTRVLPDVLSANLKIRLQVYKYLAFTAERYPQSISVLQGTGLIAPSF
jgi:HK97 family phage major capsid protein